MSALALGLLALVSTLLGAGFSLYIWRRMSGRHMPRATFADHRARLAPWVDVRCPPGDGPFPTVLLLHGCGGVRSNMSEYAEAAVAAGRAAIIVDSLGPRGISYEQALAQVCTGRRLWGRERAADLYAALEIARADPRIDPDALALAGWSHGGWTILDALVLAGQGWPPDGVDDPPGEPLKGVRAALLVYPYCGFPALSARRTGLTDIPLDVVLVERDAIASERAAAAALNRIRAAGGVVSWSVLDGVSHGFDERDHPETSPLRYDLEAAERMRLHFVDFLNKYLPAR